VIKLSVEEIRNLVRLEKDIENEVEKAKKTAADLAKKADEEARKILQKAQDQKYYDDITQVRIAEIDEKVIVARKQSGEKTKKLKDLADKNLEKTISLIVDFVIGS
jgi:vacuolar-type H+-ATPase subunit H